MWLNAYNALHAPPDDYTPLSIFVRDEDGTILGGLLGETFWTWLDIGILWIDETRRGEGLGTRLLAAAEEQAERRGCSGAFVNTMDFQAPAFYRKYGYFEAGGIPERDTHGFICRSGSASWPPTSDGILVLQRSGDGAG